MIEVIKAKKEIKDAENPKMEFNCEELEFDRDANCDWCGEEKLVGITHYGTTHYNRLICQECAERIKKYDEVTFGKGCHSIKDSVELRDENLAKVEGPNGEKVEPNKYFLLNYVTPNLKYVESEDNKFNPTKNYGMYRNNGGRTRIATATPRELNLYEFNGLNYVPSRDKFFEDKEYYLDEEGTTVATPRNCNLKEPDVSAKVYAKYTLDFIPNGRTVEKKRITSVDAPNEWETIKKVYEGCVNNAETINQVYNEEGWESTLKYIKSNFEDELNEHSDRIKMRQAETGSQNSINRNLNRQSVQVSNETYKKDIYLKCKDLTGMSPEDFIKSISGKLDKDLTPIEKEIMHDISPARRIWYNNGWFEFTTSRVDSRFLFKKEAEEGEEETDKVAYTYKFRTLEEALKAMDLMHLTRRNAAQNIKGKFGDSECYITYEVRDNKKVITGYYDSLVDAELADETKKLVKIGNGIYFNEETNKYTVKMKTNEGRLAYLGDFDSKANARDAVINFRGLEENLDDFFNSDKNTFLSEHLSECRQAQEEYFSKKNAIAKEAPEKNKKPYDVEPIGKGFRIWFYNPETKKTDKTKTFANEFQAQNAIREAENSEDPIAFFLKIKEDNAKTVAEGDIPQNLSQFEKKGLKSRNLTSTDIINLINSIDISELGKEDLKKILHGEQEKRGGVLDVYKNVKNYAKKVLDLDKEELDFHSLRNLQMKMTRKLERLIMLEIVNKAEEFKEGCEYKEDFVKRCLNYLNSEFNILDPKETILTNRIVSEREYKNLKNQIENLW